ncbi:hypothetical protein PILCRDRAFT_222937 [Piloderma croceum F 1598]|uniref:PHD-type domain-containing protein n=1 Tax=Piloderma croceum (strain F 1598) TaxID=765440 RepID=A0A0C3GCE8_PILCF|nr:hypothetical protein PILCRDRAFT_222937 [Piloderma croceum F 1598]
MTTVESAKCFRCGKTQHSPVAFKVECSECHRYWHHRCHIPPISDNELIARVRASTVNDVDNGLAGWICRGCLGGMGTSRKHRPAEVSRPANLPQSAAQSSNSTTSDPQTLPSQLPPAKKDPPVLKYKQSMVQKRPVSSRPSDRNNKSPSTSGQTRSETSSTLCQAPYPEDLRHIRPPSSRTISADDSRPGRVFPTQNATMNSTEVGSISESSSSVSGKVQGTVVDGGQLSKVCPPWV